MLSCMVIAQSNFKVLGDKAWKVLVPLVSISMKVGQAHMAGTAGNGSDLSLLAWNPL